MATCTKVSRQYQYEYGEVEDNGETRAATVWFVEYDGDTSPAAALNATANGVVVPGRRTPHPERPGLLGSRIRATPISDETRRHFRVVVEYSDQMEQLSSPLGIVTVEWSYQDEGTAPYFIDFNSEGNLTNSDGLSGKPVVDSAGVPFQDFLESSTGCITCTYSQTLAPEDFDPAVDVIPFIKTMNTSSFTMPASTAGGNAVTIGQYQARAVGLTCDGNVQTQNGVKFVTYKVVFKIRKTWLDKVESRGFYEKSTTASAGVVPIAKLQPPTAQTSRGWPLDSDGKAKTAITDTPAMLTFYPYNPVDYSSIVAAYTG